MKKIVILGGGFAGVWSAAAAIRLRDEQNVPQHDLSVTLISPSPDLVIRPRLYEQALHDVKVPLRQVLGPLGVDIVTAAATGIDVRASTVTLDGSHEPVRYDRLVLAVGSHVVRPAFPGAETVHDVDSLEAAEAFQRHLDSLADSPPARARFTAVVVGAGFTGLEVATELVGRLREVASAVSAADDVRVVVVDKADVVGPELGDGPRPVIEEALDRLAVERRTGVTIDSVDGDHVRLSDGSLLEARTVVWTAGIRAHPLTGEVAAPLDRLGRLRVDEYLAVPDAPGVYAAGDTAAPEAAPGHPVTQSCQHAIPQGKYAGHNAVASLLGVPQSTFRAAPYVTCLDLGAQGAVFTTGFERTVLHTGEAAKDIKVKINTEWIYPPVNDVRALLDQADPRSARAS
ncbi:FAD-dependent oxidoreductase [Streptomyces sp. NPDC020996]|uniref:NAD(P)/FAD-dependent oxidoreductase n=1 Tax=Streptomyces sp. NPDC020996 TaxID=3154791 RepID=UPI0033FA52A6